MDTQEAKAKASEMIGEPITMDRWRYHMKRAKVTPKKNRSGQQYVWTKADLLRMVNWLQKVKRS